MNDSSGSTTNSSLQFLALGDSYTIGESVAEKERWPVQLIDYLNKNNSVQFNEPQIIARTGWRTDELINAIEVRDPAPDQDLVSLLIGVNNQYQNKPIDTYRKEFRQLLEKAVELARDDPERVLVVSIPDYGYTPFGADDRERISRELDTYNDINRSISEELKVMYVNITDISRSEDEGLVADDNLHPSAAQYNRWVERIVSDPEFQERFVD